MVQTAAKSPTPGGGAIAALTGAHACALAGMVVSYSLGRKDLVAHQDMLAQADVRLRAAREEFVQLGDLDAQAYGALNALQKLAPDDARRVAELPGAIERATAVPLRCLRLVEQCAMTCRGLVGASNKWLVSDLVISGVLLDAAARACLCNVRINLPLIDDEARRALLTREAEGLEAKARELARQIAQGAG